MTALLPSSTGGRENRCQYVNAIIECWPADLVPDPALAKLAASMTGLAPEDVIGRVLAALHGETFADLGQRIVALSRRR